MKNLSSVRIGAAVPDRDVDRLNDNPIRPATVADILVTAAMFAAVLAAGWLMLIGLDRVMGWMGI